MSLARPIRTSLPVALLVAPLIGAMTAPAHAGRAASVGSTTPSPTASVATRPSGSYAAVVAQGSTRRLVTVRRSDGKVLRDFGSLRKTGGEEPFVDVDLALDGTVWAVVTDSRLPRSYGYRLRHYTGRRAVDVMPYATSVQASPDGRRLAVTVVSPDANRDGKGTTSLRLVTPSGGTVRMLASRTFTVDKSGQPTMQVGGLHVTAWLNSRELVVEDGCCDSGTVSIVSATTPSRMSRWPSFKGDGQTQALGTNRAGNAVLAARTLYSGDGVTVPLQNVGLEVVWMTKAKPSGKRAFTLKGRDLDVNTSLDRIVARAQAVPFKIGVNRFPYGGRGTVISAAL